MVYRFPGGFWYFSSGTPKFRGVRNLRRGIWWWLVVENHEDDDESIKIPKRLCLPTSFLVYHWGTQQKDISRFIYTSSPIKAKGPQKSLHLLVFQLPLSTEKLKGTPGPIWHHGAKICPHFLGRKTKSQCHQLWKFLPSLCVPSCVLVLKINFCPSVLKKKCNKKRHYASTTITIFQPIWRRCGA